LYNDTNIHLNVMCEIMKKCSDYRNVTETINFKKYLLSLMFSCSIFLPFDREKETSQSMAGCLLSVF